MNQATGSNGHADTGSTATNTVVRHPDGHISGYCRIGSESERAESARFVAKLAEEMGTELFGYIIMPVSNGAEDNANSATQASVQQEQHPTKDTKSH